MIILEVIGIIMSVYVLLMVIIAVAMYVKAREY